MLTGDNRRTAQAIAKNLGLKARSELLPEDKQRVVRELHGQGQTVATVGDGINEPRRWRRPMSALRWAAAQMWR